MLHSLSIPVTEASQTGEARRAALRLAGSVGFSEDAAGRVSLAATEAANNLHLHGGGGELLLRTLDRGGVGGVELLALDRGPGMADVDRCLVDGFSTLGTAGRGLGAMSRAADEFQVHSVPDKGTVVLMRFWASPPPVSAHRLIGAAVNVPLPTEEVSGDAWACRTSPRGGHFLLVDGLGHGSGAATAALEAVRTFQEEGTPSPLALLRTMHERLRPTRGAAVGVAQLDLEAGVVRYAGLGNIVSAILTPGLRTNLVSMNGIVGHQMRQGQEFTYPWPPGALLVMHTDGIGTGWKLEPYPGLTTRDPAIVSALLYRDFRRGRDDSAVLTVREGSGP